MRETWPLYNKEQRGVAVSVDFEAGYDAASTFTIERLRADLTRARSAELLARQEASERHHPADAAVEMRRACELHFKCEYLQNLLWELTGE